MSEHEYKSFERNRERLRARANRVACAKYVPGTGTIDFIAYLRGDKVNPSPNCGPLRDYYNNLITIKKNGGPVSTQSFFGDTLEVHMAKTLRLLYWDSIKEKLEKSAKEYVKAGLASPRGKAMQANNLGGKPLKIGSLTRRQAGQARALADVYLSDSDFVTLPTDDFILLRVLLGFGVFDLEGWAFPDKWLPKHELLVFTGGKTPDSRPQ